MIERIRLRLSRNKPADAAPDRFSIFGARVLSYGWALALLPCAASAFDIFDYETMRGREQLGVFAQVQQDFRIFQNVPATVTTRSELLRRARLGMRLRTHEDWIVRLSGDFARSPSLRDASVEYLGGPVRFEFGRFPEPFSLGGSMNSGDTLLMSRPSPTLLGPDYGFGAGFSTRGDDWGLSGGAFSRDVGTTLAGRYPQNAVTLRANWRPFNGEDGFVHIGMGASYRQLREGTGVLLSGTAESSLVSGFTPHSPLLSQDDLYRLWNAELALRWRSAVIISEYLQTDVNGGPSWSGEYVEAGWALTGERRGYSVRYGTLGGITPDRPLGEGGFGAVELAGRWSRTDLRSGGGDLGQIESVGLNWYPVDRLRVSLDAASERLDLADGTARHGTLVQARLQISF